MLVAQFEAAKGQSASASTAAMNRAIASGRRQEQLLKTNKSQERATCVPWTAQEELVVEWTPAIAVDLRMAWAVAASSMGLSAFASVLLALMWTLRRAVRPAKQAAEG